MNGEIVALPRPSTRQYRFDERTLERLEKLSLMLSGKTETAIVADAVGHFLSTLERDERPWMTVPSEALPAGRKAHKRPSDAV